MPNRLLEDCINQAIAQSKRDDTLLGVLYIDLDKFKTINDTLGHKAGDAVLREAARRMCDCLREGDSITRLGGDEFVICLPRLYQAEDAAVAARKVQASLAQPMHLSGHAMQIGSSIGISLYPHNGDKAESLIQAADEAMYAAKIAGGDSLRFQPALTQTMDDGRCPVATTHASRDGRLNQRSLE